MANCPSPNGDIFLFNIFFNPPSSYTANRGEGNIQEYPKKEQAASAE